MQIYAWVGVCHARSVTWHILIRRIVMSSSCVTNEESARFRWMYTKKKIHPIFHLGILQRKSSSTTNVQHALPINQPFVACAFLNVHFHVRRNKGLSKFRWNSDGFRCASITWISDLLADFLVSLMFYPDKSWYSW